MSYLELGISLQHLLRSGKSTWIERLIAENKLSIKPKIIRYHYPEQLSKPPVRWCEKFSNIQVEYERGVPSQADYWSKIEKNTLGWKAHILIIYSF